MAAKESKSGEIKFGDNTDGRKCPKCGLCPPLNYKFCPMDATELVAPRGLSAILAEKISLGHLIMQRIDKERKLDISAGTFKNNGSQYAAQRWPDNRFDAILCPAADYVDTFPPHKRTTRPFPRAGYIVRFLAQNNIPHTISPGGEETISDIICALVENEITDPVCRENRFACSMSANPREAKSDTDVISVRWIPDQTTALPQNAGITGEYQAVIGDATLYWTLLQIKRGAVPTDAQWLNRDPLFNQRTAEHYSAQLIDCKSRVDSLMLNQGIILVDGSRVSEYEKLFSVKYEAQAPKMIQKLRPTRSVLPTPEDIKLDKVLAEIPEPLYYWPARRQLYARWELLTALSYEIELFPELTEIENYAKKLTIGKLTAYKLGSDVDTLAHFAEFRSKVRFNKLRVSPISALDKLLSLLGVASLRNDIGTAEGSTKDAAGDSSDEAADEKD